MKIIYAILITFICFNLAGKEKISVLGNYVMKIYFPNAPKERPASHYDCIVSFLPKNLMLTSTQGIGDYKIKDGKLTFKTERFPEETWDIKFNNTGFTLQIKKGGKVISIDFLKLKAIKINKLNGIWGLFSQTLIEEKVIVNMHYNEIIKIDNGKFSFSKPKKRLYTTPLPVLPLIAKFTKETKEDIQSSSYKAYTGGPYLCLINNNDLRKGCFTLIKKEAGKKKE